MDYSAEAAGAVAERTLTSASATAGSTLNSIAQDLASGHWTKVIEELIDLRAGVPKLQKHIKRQVRLFMVDGYQPRKVDHNRYPDPQTIAAEIALRSGNDEEAPVVAALSKELREVRACRALATAMSGRRARPALLTRVDRRWRGKLCVRCRRKLRLGQEIFLDKDWNSAWHVAGGCHD